jgi:hypothetical protein
MEVTEVEVRVEVERLMELMELASGIEAACLLQQCHGARN